MIGIYDCEKCIHKAVCGCRLTKDGTDFKAAIDKLSEELSENMNAFVTCKYYEEVHFNGTIK